MTFKEKIVNLRKIKGLTQDEFAKAVGVSRQAVYKWESGQSYPEVPKILEIKLLFNISIDDLLDDTFEVPLPEKKRRKRAEKKDVEKTELKASIPEMKESKEEIISDGKKESSEAKSEELREEKEDRGEDVKIEATIAAKEETEGKMSSYEAPSKEENAPSESKEEEVKTSEGKEEATKKRGFFGRIFGRR